MQEPAHLGGVVTSTFDVMALPIGVLLGATMVALIYGLCVVMRRDP